MKVWDWAGIELATPGSAVPLASDCTTVPGIGCLYMADMPPVSLGHRVS